MLDKSIEEYLDNATKDNKNIIKHNDAKKIVTNNNSNSNNNTNKLKEGYNNYQNSDINYNGCDNNNYIKYIKINNKINDKDHIQYSNNIKVQNKKLNNNDSFDFDNNEIYNYKNTINNTNNNKKSLNNSFTKAEETVVYNKNFDRYHSKKNDYLNNIFNFDEQKDESNNIYKNYIEEVKNNENINYSFNNKNNIESEKANISPRGLVRKDIHSKEKKLSSLLKLIEPLEIELTKTNFKQKTYEGKIKLKQKEDQLENLKKEENDIRAKIRELNNKLNKYSIVV